MMLFAAKAVSFFMLLFVLTPIVFFSLVFVLGRFFNVIPASDSLVSRFKKIFVRK